MTADPLAERLNQLAAANSQGSSKNLSSDDDYRLLRQSLFERYSNTIVLPVEEPVVPTSTHSPSRKPLPLSPPHHVNRPGTPSLHLPSSTSGSAPHRPNTPTTHSRLRASVSVTNLFRRATGRKSTGSNLKDSITPSGVQTGGVSTSGHSHSPSISTSHVSGSPKRGVLPRILQRKPSDANIALSGGPTSPVASSSQYLPSQPDTDGRICYCDTHAHPYNVHPNASASTPSLDSLTLSLYSPAKSSHQRTNSSATMTSNHHPTITTATTSSSRMKLKNQKSFHHLPSLSVSSTTTYNSSLLTPSPTGLTSASPHSHMHFSPQESIFIFDDESLYTTQDIKKAIQMTESEFQRLIEEFTSLEMHTMHKVRLRKARRLYVSTPKDVGVLIEGKEWREYSPLPPPPICVNCTAMAGPSTDSDVGSPTEEGLAKGLKAKLKMKSRHKHSPSTSSIHSSSASMKLSPYSPNFNTGGHQWSGGASSPLYSPSPLSPGAHSGTGDDRSTRSGSSSRLSSSHTNLHSHSHSHSLHLPPTATLVRRPSTAGGSAGATTPTSVSTPTVPPSPMSLKRKGSLSSLSSFTTSLFGGGSKHGSTSTNSAHISNGSSISTGAGGETISISTSSPSLSPPVAAGSGMRLGVNGHASASSSVGMSLSRSTGHLPLSVLSEHSGEWEGEEEGDSRSKDGVIEGPGLGISCQAGEGTGVGGSTLRGHGRGRKGSVASGMYESDAGKSDHGSNHGHRDGRARDTESDGEEEVEEIRRRKIETTEKYQARLNYLRAKLKGAELHEKLLRK
ncbi:hypothetical protein AX16_009128 [Volvariella volvacea WC 439]|nr:hypothetical protein AX16_009128 [Volvariella volvacea WC 439]